MLGFYNYSVILTYVGLASSVTGMMFAISGRLKLAIFCLAFSGLCDMFDGKIARAMKNRTEDEKRFGIQIDSLCDVVCFGAFPVILCYASGMRGMISRMILTFYCLASVIRLGYFNVMEEKRQEETEEARVYYEGLPITTIAIVLPIACLLRPYFGTAFDCVIQSLMFGMAFFMIFRFKLKKPSNAMLAVLVTGVGLAVLRILHII